MVINEVGRTSWSGSHGAADFKKQDAVTRKGSCSPGPIGPWFLLLRRAGGSCPARGAQAEAEQLFNWKRPETLSRTQPS